MKVVLIALLFTAFAAAAFTQIQPLAPTAACGPGIVNFGVKLDDSQHTPIPPDPGKARVYFLHDAGSDHTFAYPTVKVALDGTWAGANHANSYFSVSVEPGEHHVCVTLQSSLVDYRVELAHFTAEADKVYFFRTRLILSRSVELLELNPLDTDQGLYLITTFPLSLSKPRK